MKAMRAFSILIIVGSVVIMFQNCGKISAVSVDAASTSQSIDHSSPHIMPGGSMAPGKDLDFTIFDNALAPSASVTWSHKLSGVANACAIKTSAISKTYTINCGPAGELTVSATVTDGNSPIKMPDYVTTLVNPTPTPLPNLPPATPGPGTGSGTIAIVVEFNIPAGTGTKPWNTAATTVESFIGQTVKMNNLDAIKHRLHTGGSPCPHGADFQPGTSANCVITRALAATGVVYDHNIGPSARFYLIAYDGTALYATNCAGCHGALAASTVAKKTVANIQTALATAPAMIANAGIQKLTLRQLEAIAYALGAR